MDTYPYIWKIFGFSGVGTVDWLVLKSICNILFSPHFFLIWWSGFFLINMWKILFACLEKRKKKKKVFFSSSSPVWLLSITFQLIWVLGCSSIVCSWLKCICGSFEICWVFFVVVMGFPGGSEGKESACNIGDSGLIPGSERSPGGGNGNRLQYSCLENPKKIPFTEEPGGLQSMGSQRVRHYWVKETFTLVKQMNEKMASCC